MKANEIMVGDWVKYTNPLYIKVESLTKKKIGYHEERGESRMHYIRLCEIEPIPLTKEILKKNGFTRNYEEEKKLSHILGENFEGFYNIPTLLESPFMLENWNGVFTITDHCFIQIKYLHQLQHALRLCGIEKEIEL